LPARSNAAPALAAAAAMPARRLTGFGRHVTDDLPNWIGSATQVGKLVATRKERIHWGDCDPAGIIYYPRYFEIFDRSTTAMFEQALGMNKIQYLAAYDFSGHPCVETGARFFLPTRFGDDLMVESAVVELGRSSIRIRHRLTRDGKLAVEGSETRVWVRRQTDDSKSIRAHPLPDEVVAKLGGR
jgi:4-hydroxybenzoyl-CoA thioesterase